MVNCSNCSYLIAHKQSKIYDSTLVDAMSPSGLEYYYPKIKRFSAALLLSMRLPDFYNIVNFFLNISKIGVGSAYEQVTIIPTTSKKSKKILCLCKGTLINKTYCIKKQQIQTFSYISSNTDTHPLLLFTHSSFIRSLKSTQTPQPYNEQPKSKIALQSIFDQKFRTQG